MHPCQPPVGPLRAGTSIPGTSTVNRLVVEESPGHIQAALIQLHGGEHHLAAVLLYE